MSIYIYLTDADRERWKKAEDSEVDDLYQEAKKFDKTIIVTETTTLINRWFRKPQPVTTYSVLYDNGYDARYVNFPPGARTKWTICTNVPKQMVMTYLYGFITAKIKPPTNA